MVAKNSTKKRVQENLSQSEEALLALINATRETLLLLDRSGTILFANEITSQRLGKSIQKLTGTCLYDHLPTDVARLRKEQFDKAIHTGKPVHFEDTREGRFFDIYCYPVVNEERMVSRVAVFAHEITERKVAENQFIESEERYRVAIEHSNDGVAIVRGNQHIYVNQKFLEIFGYDRPEEIIGNPTYMTVHPDDQKMVVEYNQKRQKGESVPSRYEFKGIQKDGTAIFVEVSAAAIVYRGEPCSLVYLRDISERRKLEEKLRAMSITDELTGLYNRRGFVTLAQQQLKIETRANQDMLLFFGDLDNMKKINDTLGHLEGDNALIDIAAILKETFRESDIIGRIGGDEFAVLAINTADGTREILAARLQDRLEIFNSIEAKPYKLHLSIGIAHYNPKIPCSLDELMTQADTLMYEEKRRKHN